MRAGSRVGLCLVGALVLATAACGGADAEPAEPWAGREDVDDTAVRGALLIGMDDSQRTCVEAEIDDERLLALVGHTLDALADRPGPDPDPGDHALLASCLDRPQQSLAPEFLQAMGEALPRVPAPHGLGAVHLPATTADVGGLMDRIASDGGGRYAEETTRIRVFFGAEEDQFLLAFNSSSNFLAPTAGQVLALFALGADWEVLAAAREGDLVWVRWWSTEDGEPFEILQWGTAGSDWVFSVLAPTREEVDETTDRFVRLAGDR